MRSYLITIFFFIVFVCAGKGEDKLQYVNPFIGTAQSLHPSNWEGHGRTYPGAVAPFGFMQLTPETSVGSWKGYEFQNKNIYFFSCFGHRSGYPDGSAGRCFVMPVKNAETFELWNTSRPFLHSGEIAEPGYYKVKFGDNGTSVETTATTRSGMFRFSFPEESLPKIFIGDIGDFETCTDTKIKGSNRNVFFEFNQKWKRIEKQKDGVILTFNKSAANIILLKLSSSSVGTENAKENLNAEMPGWNFEQVKNKTQADWEKQLSLIDVSDDSRKNKVKFYSALYHSSLFPWIVSDVNKAYKGKDQLIHHSKGAVHYDAFSPWDTFRSLHPLFCLIAPQRQNDMILSMLEIFKQSGQLPSDPMTGFHAIPIIADSYLKGVRDFDSSLAYRAMMQSLTKEPFHYEDMPTYIEKGFVSASYPESVTRTVEYAYNDWALAQYAKEAMKNLHDYSLFQKRGLNYRNLFDPQQLFLVPRIEKKFIKSYGNFGFKEGDKWNYSFFVPHNPRDLINRMGGDEEFTNLLDSAIRNNHILFDNEPNFHIPYLFNYSKAPWKTQEVIANVCDEYFTDTPGGLPGNDDLGTMSAWFVFNAMGIFPVCPGVPEYNIGTPLFDKVVIHLNNQEFVITKTGKSEDKYIQSATLNRKNFKHSWMKHSTLLKGGKLNFVMGENPSDWATNPTDEAYSVTKKSARIIVETISVSNQQVEPNEKFWVKFRLRNNGAAGVKIVRLIARGKEVATANVFVEKDATVVDSVSCKLYKSGFAKLNIKGTAKAINVGINESEFRRVEYSGLSLSPMIKPNEKQQISFYMKNVGGKTDNPELKIILNGKLAITDNVLLEPGEAVNLKYELKDYKPGENKFRIGSLTGYFKVCTDNLSSTLVDLDLKKLQSEKITDKSGFSNHGILKTDAAGAFHKKGFDDKTFVEIRQNHTFSALKKEITLMAWVKASEANSGLSSLITQGDHNVIQIINNSEIEFFTGGWGRGICLAKLPDDYLGKWHHIAGVCDGKTLKLYVNGELKGTAEISREVPLNAHGNWNLGRNEEFPNKRIFYGKMDRVKIYASALAQSEIREIVTNDKIK